MSTFSEIQSLIVPSLPSQEVDLPDNAAVLTVAQALELIRAGVRFGDDDILTVSDTAANLEGLSAGDIGDIARMGGSSLVATDRALDLTLAQINAIADADMTAFSRYQTFSETTAVDTQVNAVGTGEQTAQSIVALAGGGYVIAWHSPDLATGDQIILCQRFDSEGNKVGEETLVNTTVLQGSGQQRIVALENGSYLVVWTNFDADGTELYSQLFDAEGKKVGVETLINPGGGEERLDPTVLALPGGGFAVTWIEGSTSSGRNIAAQVFDANGVPVGAEFSFGVGILYSGRPSDLTVAALSDGNFVVAWTSADDGSSSGVYAQVISTAGTLVGSAIPVNSYKTGVQHQQAICPLSNGDFVISWTSSGRDGSAQGIYAQRFDHQGNPLGTEFQVNTYIQGSQVASAVTGLSGGGYVVTWSSYGQDGTSMVANAQVFDAEGNRSGGEIRVGSSIGPNGFQNAQKVVALPGGGFAVTWISPDPGNADAGIYMQVFDANGQKIGAEVHVNNYTNDRQDTPLIEILANGDFVITWKSYGQDGDGYGIFTKRFTRDTDKVSFKAASNVVSALVSADIANFAEVGVTSVKVADAGHVTLAKDVAVLLSAVRGLEITGAASVTVTGTGRALDDLSATEVAALKAIGVTAMDVSDQAIALSLAQADAFDAAGIAFAGNDIVTVRATADDLAGFSAGKITALAGMGASILDLFGNAASLTITRASLLKDAGLRFAAGDVVAIADTGANVASLSSTDIASLGALGVSVIDLTDGALALTADAIGRFLSAGIRFAASDEVVVEDSAAAIQGLGAADIAAFAGAGVDRVRALHGDVTLNTTQLVAFGANGVSVGAVSGSVKVSGTGASIAALDMSAIAYFSALGITSLDASNDHITLSLAQVNAFRSAGVRFSGEDVITLSLARGQAGSLTGTAVATLAGFGVKSIASTEAELSFTAAQLCAIRQNGISLASGYTAILSDKAEALLALASADLGIFSDIGLDGVQLADTGRAFASLSIADITTIGRLGATSAHVTDGAVSLTMVRAIIFASNGLVFEETDTVVVTATAASLKDPDITDIPTLRAINVDRIDVSDGSLILSLTEANAFVGAGIGFVASDAISVKLSLSEAQAFGRTAADALHAAGVDRIEIDMTPQQVASLTYPQLKAFLAAGIDGISNVQLLNFGTFTYDLVTHQINYAPVIVSNGGGTAAAVNVPENTTAVTKVIATDANPGTTLTYSIAGGADQGLFAIDARTGVLSFKAAPDFESPKDAGKDNLYDVTVRVSDGRLIDTQAIRIKVTDIKGYSFIGTSGADRMTGSPEHDLLDGRAGADIMSGGKGNDTYVVDNAGDRVIELVNEGIDQVRASVSHALAANVENLTLVGSSAINGTGNALANRIVGNAANNALDGGAGADTMSGGKGNDTYVVDNAGDRIVELVNEGIDLVRASVSHALAANVENLVLTGSGNLNGIGNTLANSITGNAGRNVLDGGAGNDVLKGDAGNDQLFGGLGADQLFGGSGADTFVFKSVKESTLAASGQDTIFDFARREGDLIDLRAIDANIAAGGEQAFTLIGADAFHKKAGELRYEKKGGFTYVSGDIQGDGIADFAIKFQGTIDFGKVDFVL